MANVTLPSRSVMARPRSEEARTKIVSASQELIAEVGVEGFTVDAVAARSGVAKTTIYRHFPSGDELLIHTIDATVEPFETPNTGALRSDLIAIYEQIVPVLEDPSIFGMMMGVLAKAAKDPEFARLKDEIDHVRKMPVRTVLELAQARGEVRSDADLDVLVEMVEGPIAARKVLGGRSIVIAELPTIIDLVIGGIAPNGGRT